MSPARPGLGINDRISALEVPAPTVGEVLSISLEDVTIHPQVRRNIEPAKLEELMDAIRQEGQRQPVEAYFESNSYVLVTGERRFQALTKLGRSVIEVKAIKKPTPTELIYLQVTENEKREALGAIDLALAIKELAAAGEDNASIASRLGMSASVVGRYKAIGKGSQRIHNAYHSGVKDLRALELLAQIEAKWPNAFDELLDQVVSGKIMRDELETWKKHLKANGEMPKAEAAPAASAAPADDAQAVVDGAANDADPDMVADSSVLAGEDEPEQESDDPTLTTVEAQAEALADAESEAAGAGDLPWEDASEEGDSQGESSEDKPQTAAPSPAKMTPATPVEKHYEPTHEDSKPEQICIVVKGKLASGEAIKGTLMLDRVDQDSNWAWVQPDDADQLPVKIEAKKLKMVSVTA
ncbi:ParB/RepB/Spo0J family partition protein [Vreelandella rituensis]|uniref:ParB/RepB/Spo0J family partition protein n=1 Tax=Vreelandella rituensis TaxID=2282306 RepID=A0A368U9J9_9GAMM|nr:ParB/RepB/Spo0J family partition protein [Halomonas rituensis]RCV93899.1 ParB/RepB/Spo0J family partition protein [Halomonas rituensis]